MKKAVPGKRSRRYERRNARPCMRLRATIHHHLDLLITVVGFGPYLLMAIGGLDLTVVSELYPNLSFAFPEFETIFELGSGWLEPEIKDAFDDLMIRCVGPGGLYRGKVVMGIKPFVIHLFDPQFPENRIAWMVPARHYIKIRLYAGTSVGNVLNLVTHPNMRGTPYPIEICVVDKSENEVAMTYLEDSSRRRNRE